MRVSKAQAAENRERILDAAARLFRERGLAGVGVDALADAAGLTHGGLYSQFGSKDQLAAQALDYALAASAEKTSRAESLAGYVAQYLSPAHRDAPGSGCPLAALACDAARQGDALRTRFTTGVNRLAARLKKLSPGQDAEDGDAVALGIVATMVGALILSRAVGDPDLSKNILTGAKARILSD